MIVLKVTPIRNVLIGKRCFKSEKTDMFFSKVVNEGSKIDVYDVVERKQKAVFITDLNRRNHRMIINNKRYFICSVSKCAL
ncbi:MAG: hypothetical protein ACOYWZ_22825 [Bacillota bacterium]